VYKAFIIIHANGQKKGSRKNVSVSASEGLDLVSSPKSKVSVLSRSRKIFGGSCLGLISGGKPKVSVSSRSRAPRSRVHPWSKVQQKLKTSAMLHQDMFLPYRFKSTKSVKVYAYNGRSKHNYTESQIDSSTASM
jgi:hypothetical protein